MYDVLLPVRTSALQTRTIIEASALSAVSIADLQSSKIFSCLVRTNTPRLLRLQSVISLVYCCLLLLPASQPIYSVSSWETLNTQATQATQATLYER
jgi:hypothetical protein